MRALLSANWKAQSVSFQMINHQANDNRPHQELVPVVNRRVQGGIPVS